MAQFSPNTSSYDTAVYKISKFFDKYYNNEFKNYDEFIQEYQKLIQSVHDSSNGVITKYEPLIKGQPPRSGQLVRYATDITADSAIVSRQIDYLAAKTVSSYNLFASEISKESNFLERINSKIKVLQLYSKSSSDDIYYYGDSFDNMEYVDTSINYDMPLASAVDGYLALPIVAGSTWSIEYSNIINKDTNGNIVSNGFSGNNHMARLKSITNASQSRSKHQSI